MKIEFGELLVLSVPKSVVLEKPIKTRYFGRKTIIFLAQKEII